MSPMLVIGSVGLDTIHNPSGTHTRVVGGSAIYASIAGSAFGAVRLVGVVGRDFPEPALRMLEGRGVDLAGLEVAEGKTFHWEGRYSDDLTSRTTLKTDLNVFASFRPRIPDSFRSTPFVMLGNIDPELQLDVLNQVDRPALVIADTMNFWIEGKPEELAKTLAKVDVLVINEEEARQLAGAYNIVKVAKAIRAMGPRIVIIKQGEYGALLFDSDDVFSAPAYPVETVLDPTGAGDSFAGGLLGFVARAGDVSRSTLRRAVIYGSALASFCVEGISTERLEHVDEAAVQERFEQFRRLAHFATDAELARPAGAERRPSSDT